MGCGSGRGVGARVGAGVGAGVGARVRAGVDTGLGPGELGAGVSTAVGREPGAGRAHGTPAGAAPAVVVAERAALHQLRGASVNVSELRPRQSRGNLGACAALTVGVIVASAGAGVGAGLGAGVGTGVGAAVEAATRVGAGWGARDAPRSTGGSVPGTGALAGAAPAAPAGQGAPAGARPGLTSAAWGGGAAPRCPPAAAAPAAAGPPGTAGTQGPLGEAAGGSAAARPLARAARWLALAPAAALCCVAFAGAASRAAAEARCSGAGSSTPCGSGAGPLPGRSACTAARDAIEMAAVTKNAAVTGWPHERHGLPGTRGHLGARSMFMLSPPSALRPLRKCAVGLSLSSCTPSKASPVSKCSVIQAPWTTCSFASSLADPHILRKGRALRDTAPNLVMGATWATADQAARVPEAGPLPVVLAPVSRLAVWVTSNSTARLAT